MIIVLLVVVVVVVVIVVVAAVIVGMVVAVESHTHLKSPYSFMTLMPFPFPSLTSLTRLPIPCWNYSLPFSFSFFFLFFFFILFFFFLYLLSFYLPFFLPSFLHFHVSNGNFFHLSIFPSFCSCLFFFFSLSPTYSISSSFSSSAYTLEQALCFLFSWGLPILPHPHVT